jgi:hypothetical protein
LKKSFFISFNFYSCNVYDCWSFIKCIA